MVLAPSPRCDFVFTHSARSIRSSRSSSECDIPFRRTVFVQSAFTVKVLNQCNTLPDDLRCCSSPYLQNKPEKMIKSCSCLYSLTLKSGLYYQFLILQADTCHVLLCVALLPLQCVPCVCSAFFEFQIAMCPVFFVKAARRLKHGLHSGVIMCFFI